MVMGCGSRGDRRGAWGSARKKRGQSSVEYALVLLAFLSMVAAWVILWYGGRDGALLDRAVASSSHQLGGGDVIGSLRDLALF